MAKQTKTPQWKKKAFVRYELDAEQLRSCKLWKPSGEELDEEMYKFTDASYKISFSYDAYNKCEQVLCQTDNDSDPNADKILVGRGSTPLKAFKQLWWKHWKGCDGIWPTPDFTPGGSEWDD